MSKTLTTLAVAVALVVGGVPAQAEEDASPAELLPNGILLDGDLLVGGQPTVEQLGRLSELGYRSVINLRGEGEPSIAAEEIRALGLEPISLPVASATDLDEDHARRLAQALQEAEGPVVLHCGSGNRVGALLALKAHWVDGETPGEALETGRASGLTGLEDEVREILAAGEAGG